MCKIEETHHSCGHTQSGKTQRCNKASVERRRRPLLMRLCGSGAPEDCGQVATANFDARTPCQDCRKKLGRKRTAPSQGKLVKPTKPSPKYHIQHMQETAQGTTGFTYAAPPVASRRRPTQDTREREVLEFTFTSPWAATHSQPKTKSRHSPPAPAPDRSRAARSQGSRPSPPLALKRSRAVRSPNARTAPPAWDSRRSSSPIDLNGPQPGMPESHAWAAGSARARDLALSYLSPAHINSELPVRVKTYRTWLDVNAQSSRTQKTQSPPKASDGRTPTRTGAKHLRRADEGKQGTDPRVGVKARHERPLPTLPRFDEGPARPAVHAFVQDVPARKPVPQPSQVNRIKSMHGVVESAAPPPPSARSRRGLPLPPLQTGGPSMGGPSRRPVSPVSPSSFRDHNISPVGADGEYSRAYPPARRIADQRPLERPSSRATGNWPSRPESWHFSGGEPLGTQVIRNAPRTRIPQPVKRTQSPPKHTTRIGGWLKRLRNIKEKDLSNESWVCKDARKVERDPPKNPPKPNGRRR
ncbi:hypothetical protein B0T25DRAFT_26665 [Lasiosphaeria hispida]|uniref:Uncharacterized protein n=1 Tax=Lasiosphaeria hispida TaxID=260671 RepID=A0AAJ0HU79_9PEZI|nr:hypothetical protein B0T25DRAFT_26665 [Lasiosphaeria hispida]